MPTPQTRNGISTSNPWQGGIEQPLAAQLHGCSRIKLEQREKEEALPIIALGYFIAVLEGGVEKEATARGW